MLSFKASLKIKFSSIQVRGGLFPGSYNQMYFLFGVVALTMWLISGSLGTGHYLSPAGGGGGGGGETADLRLNKVKSRRPLFACYFTEVIPPKQI